MKSLAHILTVTFSMIWRLIEDGAHSGAWNMARDEALLLSQAEPGALPTLRFYEWQPSCLSLGRFQKSYVPPSGVDWVRRPTGGRAVWHQHEVTYCAVFPTSLLPAGATSVVAAYRWLTQGFLCGLQELGVQAELSRGETHSSAQKVRLENCFLSNAQCDTVVDGRKLIGAAQCRKNADQSTLVLQHGSLLLDIERDAWHHALGDSTEAMQQLVSLRELGVTASPAEVKAALVRGMAQELNAQFEVGALSERELSAAQQLWQEKYSSESWNRAAQEMASPNAASNSRE